MDPGLLIERNESIGLDDLHDYDGHWFMKPRLLSPRRNHDCVVHNGRLINIVGRFSPNVEALDLKTGKQTLMGEDPDLLGMNHASVTMVSKLDGTGLELWIPCGFVGNGVNEEESMTHVTVIDADTLTASRGPEIDRPRGACGSTALFLDGLDQPALVCIFGGSDGTHDAGEMLSIVSCYDRVRESWRYLPPLPVAGDHLNVVQMAGGACDEEGSDKHQRSISPPRVLALHIRSKNYGRSRPEVYALDMDAETGAVMSNDWYVFATSEEHDVRDAAGVVLTDDSTALVSLGGVNHGGRRKGLDRRTNVQSQVGEIGDTERFVGGGPRGTGQAKISVLNFGILILANFNRHLFLVRMHELCGKLK